MGEPKIWLTSNTVHTEEMNKFERGVPNLTYNVGEKISKQSNMGKPKERNEIEFEEGEILEQNCNEDKYLFQENMVVDLINWELDALDDKQSMTSTINQFTDNFGIMQKTNKVIKKKKEKYIHLQTHL